MPKKLKFFLEESGTKSGDEFSYRLTNDGLTKTVTNWDVVPRVGELISFGTADYEIIGDYLRVRQVYHLLGENAIELWFEPQESEVLCELLKKNIGWKGKLKPKKK